MPINNKIFVFLPVAAPAHTTATVVNTPVTAHPPTTSPQAMPVDGPPSRKVKRSAADDDGRPRKARRTGDDSSPGCSGVRPRQQVVLERKRKREVEDDSKRDTPLPQKPVDYEANTTIFPFAPPRQPSHAAGNVSFSLTHRVVPEVAMQDVVAVPDVAVPDSVMADPAVLPKVVAVPHDGLREAGMDVDPRPSLPPKPVLRPRSPVSSSPPESPVAMSGSTEVSPLPTPGTQFAQLSLEDPPDDESPERLDLARQIEFLSLDDPALPERESGNTS
jgi:hypothetical protein